MEFNSNKAIFLQIRDTILERILSGDLKPGDRIPSVREYGATIGVNPNTVMRTYERLTSEGVIHNKRGIGYSFPTTQRELCWRIPGRSSSKRRSRYSSGRWNF